MDRNQIIEYPENSNGKTNFSDAEYIADKGGKAGDEHKTGTDDKADKTGSNSEAGISGSAGAEHVADADDSAENVSKERSSGTSGRDATKHVTSTSDKDATKRMTDTKSKDSTGQMTDTKGKDSTEQMTDTKGKDGTERMTDTKGKDGTERMTDTKDKDGTEHRSASEAVRERIIRANAGKLCRTWLKQADEASGIYPGFNFHRELQNPRFCAILKNGIDVRTAYEVIHHDEIIPAALRCAVLDAEKKLANKLMSNEARPIENGSGAGAGATLGTGVSKMSKANRDDIVRRVMRGEIIRF